jgi:hypothetical protein
VRHNAGALGQYKMCQEILDIIRNMAPLEPEKKNADAA